MKNEKLCYTAQELSVQLGLSLSKVRLMTRQQKIPHIRVGRRIIYPVKAINQWIEDSREKENHNEQEE